MNKFLVAIVTALFCCSCALGFSNRGQAPELYVLEVDLTGIKPASAKNSGRLAVNDTESSELFNNDRIVFKIDLLRRGYYQFAFWGEALPNRLTTLLIEAIERKQLFASVGRHGAGPTSQFLLNSEILDFHHDATTSPGIVLIELRLELTNIEQRHLMATKTFEVSEPTATSDATGAVSAFRVATQKLAGEVTDWLEGTLVAGGGQ